MRSTPPAEAGCHGTAAGRVRRSRLDDDITQTVNETLAAEVPVAMQFNARPHAVMMATPANLDDFAFGFALTERIITSVSELTLADISGPSMAWRWRC